MVSNCKMYWTQIAKCICLQLQKIIWTFEKSSPICQAMGDRFRMDRFVKLCVRGLIHACLSSLRIQFSNRKTNRIQKRNILILSDKQHSRSHGWWTTVVLKTCYWLRTVDTDPSLALEAWSGAPNFWLFLTLWSG